VLTGGAPLSLPDGRCYFAPTVVVDADPGCELVREESFAPILTVLRAPDVETAVGLANSGTYALNGSVFSRRLGRARRIAAEMVAGGVNINDAMFGAAVPGLPFGGEGVSGYGRLQGAEGLRQFSRAKSVVQPRWRGAPALTGRVFTGRKLTPATWHRLLRLAYGSRGGPSEPVRRR
jgi:aldehyde dehydrogenase (NAD+)